MRYAYGILIGAILPGVIFLGASANRIAGIGDVQSVLDELWGVYQIWFVASIVLAILPLLIIFFVRKDMFREFLIFEAGGFGLFAPMWLFIATEISGSPWYSILIEGITRGLVGFGPGGDIIGIDVSNIFLIPFLALSVVTGLIFLRPSFITKYGHTGELPELIELKEDTVTKGGSPIDAEMPEIHAPKPTADSVASLRDILMEHGTTDPVINLILNSGIGTTTELAATSADQLAIITGLGKREAEDLLMAVQKKIWFGDI
ncbi:MAG: helix-hairpin-helix domain-containing protein [Candidatus Thorarchaeota archaeon]|nr:MAG: helix-hairpin-helix domain-containing protein [Candidatus Thorarchaeota archaeon]